MGTIRIRRPTAPPAAATSAPTFALRGAVSGKRAGIRTDRAWRSWQLIASVWRERLEHDGVSVLDVEKLRLHYAETLRHWLERFDDRVEQIRERFDDRFVRMWRLYLASARASFLTGDLQLFQILMARAPDNGIPWTRDAVYADRPSDTL